jgi:enoyl-[acyl-carrier protein] reductase II
MYPGIEALMAVIEEEQVGIVFTSAGNPETWTGWLKDRGITVVHVTSSARFAKKAETAGVHAVVAEGFEAGGHNGREETTTFCLVPMVRHAVQIPVIAAGGISSGRSMLAALALGADGVQVGSRFAASEESSAHPDFKQAIINSAEGDTKLSLKKLAPVRLLRNEFARTVEEAELGGADKAALLDLLGRGRAKSGMFEGDLENGELEIGQVSAMIREIQPAAAIVKEIWEGFLRERGQLLSKTL